ncbi:MAG: MTAP family purine nucleoside phosphorylase [Bdellovibrionales bacterium]
MWGIIGGSGFEKFDGFEKVADLPRETPFGLASSGFKKVRIGGQEALFLSRHGEHHEHLPTEVNYRANIFALKSQGVKGILSFSAVGSLQAELAPGDMVIPTQYIDRTKGVRKHTFCGDGIVGHMSLAHPVCETAAKRVFEIAQAEKVKVHYGKTYVCIEGPNFSTYAESMSYRDLKADIIGMTNFPEYGLAREAGLTYMPCSFVTDYDCWDTSRPHVTIDEVITTMRQNNAKGFKVLQKVLAAGPSVLSDCQCNEGGLKNGLMMPKEAIPAKHKAWMDVLMS